MATQTLELAGDDFAIHQEDGVRNEVAGSIAARLSLSPEFMVDRLNQLHRIAPYDDQG